MWQSNCCNGSGSLRNPDGGGFGRHLQQYPPRPIGTDAGTDALLVTAHHRDPPHRRACSGSTSGDRSGRGVLFAGVVPARLILFACVSGALAAWRPLRWPGPLDRSPSISTRYGFMAIIVAFLGRLHPVGILLAGPADGADLAIGGELAQFMLGLPAAAIQLFQGMLLFFLLRRCAVQLLHSHRRPGVA